MQKCRTVASSSFSNVGICCFSLSFSIINEESLGFGLLVGQKQTGSYRLVAALHAAIMICYFKGDILCSFSGLWFYFELLLNCTCFSAQKAHQFSHTIQCCSSVFPLRLKHFVLAPVSSKGPPSSNTLLWLVSSHTPEPVPLTVTSVVSDCSFWLASLLLWILFFIMHICEKVTWFDVTKSLN